MKRETRKIPRSPEQIAEHNAIHERFKAWKPTLAELLKSGDVKEVMTMSEMFELQVKHLKEKS